MRHETWCWYPFKYIKVFDQSCGLFGGQKGNKMVKSTKAKSGHKQVVSDVKFDSGVFMLSWDILFFLSNLEFKREVKMDYKTDLALPRDSRNFSERSIDSWNFILVLSSDTKDVWKYYLYAYHDILKENP